MPCVLLTTSTPRGATCRCPPTSLATHARLAASCCPCLRSARLPAAFRHSVSCMQSAAAVAAIPSAEFCVLLLRRLRFRMPPHASRVTRPTTHAASRSSGRLDVAAWGPTSVPAHLGRRGARRDTYPELQRARRCRLVVFGFEVEGHWGTEAVSFPRLLARARAASVHATTHSSTAAAYVARWSGLITVAAQRACAVSLRDFSLASARRPSGSSRRELAYARCAATAKIPAQCATQAACAPADRRPSAGLCCNSLGRRHVLSRTVEPECSPVRCRSHRPAIHSGSACRKGLLHGGSVRSGY